MDVQILASILGGLVGGFFTFLGVLITIAYERSKDAKEERRRLKEKEEEIESYKAETREYDVVLHVKPEKANKIHASVIDGKKCIVIPMEENEQATINGVNTTL